MPRTLIAPLRAARQRVHPRLAFFVRERVHQPPLAPSPRADGPSVRAPDTPGNQDPDDGQAPPTVGGRSAWTARSHARANSV